MAPVNYQTITLSKGKHASPEEGACVMELASMIAGEPFSDRPASVCPVIGSFLRAYNDTISYERRQDLYGYAAKVVGSRAGPGVQKARAELLAAWAPVPRHGRLRRWLPAALVKAADAWQPPVDYLGASAVQSIGVHCKQTHAKALALVDQLLAIGQAERVGWPPTPVRSSAGSSGPNPKAAAAAIPRGAPARGSA
jgi:hypothetical protein